MSYKKQIIAIFIYALITLIFTWPLALHLTTAVPTIEKFQPKFKYMTDEYSEIWITWQLQKSIEHKESFFFIKDTFYPVGIDFTIADHRLAISTMMLPIILLTDNMILANNLIIILSFILSAYAVFLLSFYFIKDEKASFVAGLIFAFCSAKIAHVLAAHLAIISLQWIPFCVLFFLKSLDQKRPLYCLLAAVFFTLNTLTSYYLAVFLGIFLFFLVLLNLKKLISTKALPTLATFGGIVFVLHLPLLLRLTHAALSGYFPHDEAIIRYSYYYGADLLGFIIPGFFHSIFKDNVLGFYSNFAGNAWEHTTYIGFATLFLWLFSVYKFRRERNMRILNIMAAIFFVLSLGGVAWIHGVPVRLWGELVPLPQAIFNHIPILNNIRMPSRFFFLMILCCSITAARGLSFILKKYAKWAIAIILALSLLILFENMCIPIPLNTLHMPQAYKEIAKEEGDFAVLDVPFCIASGYRVGGFPWTTSQFYQTIHRKNMLGGVTGRVPIFLYEYYHKLPLIGSLMRVERMIELKPIEKEFDRYSLDEAIAFFDLRYIVVHKAFANSSTHRYIHDLVGDISIQKKYPDGFIKYELKRDKEKEDYGQIDFSEGSSALYTIKGFKRYPGVSSTVWADKKATLAIRLKEKQDTVIELEILARKKTSLEILVNKNKTVIPLNRGTTIKKMVLKAEDIHKGLNFLDFKSPTNGAWGLKSLKVIKP